MSASDHASLSGRCSVLAMLSLGVVVVGVMTVVSAGAASVPLLWAQLLVELRRHLVGACLFLVDADTSTGRSVLIINCLKYIYGLLLNKTRAVN